MYEKYLLKIEEAGKIRNLKERSILCYKNYVSYFLNYVGKAPEDLTCQDVRDFLLTKKDSGIKATTLNLYNSAIRFFYRNVLHIPWDYIVVPRMIHLHYNDISRTNMQIHVRNTKNRMDRYTILSKRNLSLLTEYWFQKGKPCEILFPNKFTGGYLTVSTIEQVMRRSVVTAELEGKYTPPSLRHSFATHLMENGVEQRNIQVPLGYRDPKSTEVYLHVSNKSLMGIQSPFDRKKDESHE